MWIFENIRSIRFMVKLFDELDDLGGLSMKLNTLIVFESLVYRVNGKNFRFWNSESESNLYDRLIAEVIYFTNKKLLKEFGFKIETLELY